MTITNTGSAGCNFDITTTNTSTTSGNKIVEAKIATAIRTLTFTDSSYVAVLSGNVGTSGTTVDLSSIQDVNDGTYYLRLQDNSSPITIASLLTIIIYNKDATNAITVVPGASNSFLAASEQITVNAGSAVQLSFASGKTVDGTHKNIKLIGAAINLSCDIYILGN